jgi:hypothetical protein
MLLDALYHISMPACLPGKEMAGLEKIGTMLVERLMDVARTFSRLDSSLSTHVWEGICRSLEICRNINRGGRLNINTLLHAFRNLEHDVVLIIHVAAQNAAVTIRRTKE